MKILCTNKKIHSGLCDRFKNEINQIGMFLYPSLEAELNQMKDGLLKKVAFDMKMANADLRVRMQAELNSQMKQIHDDMLQEFEMKMNQAVQKINMNMNTAYYNHVQKVNDILMKCFEQETERMVSEGEEQFKKILDSTVRVTSHEELVRFIYNQPDPYLMEQKKKSSTEAKIEIVKRMLQRGRYIQEIVDDTGVSEDEVKELAGKYASNK